jgi:hypothetical protein
MRLNDNLRRLIESKSSVSPESAARAIHEVGSDMSAIGGDIRSAIQSLEALQKVAAGAGDDAFASKVRASVADLKRLDDALGKAAEAFNDHLDGSELLKISKRVSRGWNPEQ